MGRWIAIGTVPGWDSMKTFSAALTESSKWRPTPQTTITTVLALGDGRMMAECHAPAREEFETWLRTTGWKVESLAPITHLAKTGSIWKV